MSPEQWESTAAACHRSDIYAVGVVFYRMVVGALPVGRPASIEEAIGASKPVMEWLAEMVAPKPVDRPQSAAEALNRLAEAVGRADQTA